MDEGAHPVVAKASGLADTVVDEVMVRGVMHPATCNANALNHARCEKTKPATKSAGDSDKASVLLSRSVLDDDAKQREYFHIDDLLGGCAKA